MAGDEVYKLMIGWEVRFRNRALSIDVCGTPYEVLQTLSGMKVCVNELAHLLDTEIQATQLFSSGHNPPVGMGPVIQGLYNHLEGSEFGRAKQSLLENPSLRSSKGVIGLLHHYVTAGNEPVVRFLINHGTSVDDKPGPGMTPLHWASAAGDRRIVQLLAEEGADPSLESWFCLMPAHLASLNGHPDLAGYVAALRPELEPDRDTFGVLEAMGVKG